MAIDIRELVAEDVAEFQRLRLEALQTHPQAFGASYTEEAALPLAQVAQRLASGTVIGGFQSDGALQGMIGVSNGQSAKVRHLTTLWGMYVAPSARGTGLAARLLDAAIGKSSADCRSLRLSVVSTNLAARRLYEAAGFTEWAVDTACLCVDGVFYDEVLMRRDIDGRP